MKDHEQRAQRLFLVFSFHDRNSIFYRVVIEFNMHYRDHAEKFYSQIPLSNYTDVARVFFSPQDFEMWEQITKTNMKHRQLDILTSSRDLMFKQGKIFEAT